MLLSGFQCAYNVILVLLDSEVVVCSLVSSVDSVFKGDLLLAEAQPLAADLILDGVHRHLQLLDLPVRSLLVHVQGVSSATSVYWVGYIGLSVDLIRLLQSIQQSCGAHAIHLGEVRLLGNK